MKKHFKILSIFIIVSLFCTGCNIKNLPVIKIDHAEDSVEQELNITKLKDGTILIKEKKSETNQQEDDSFNEQDIQFGPGEINFAH